jgi:hypothetical protein
VGQTLTANTDYLGGSGTISYQWMRDETTAIGTDSNTYILQSADEGSTITVIVTRKKDNSRYTLLGEQVTMLTLRNSDVIAD